MATAVWGRRTWSGQRDSDSYRTYKIKWLVLGDYLDGPANVMQAAGMPVPGTPWLFDADMDIWAWCRPDMDVKIHQELEGTPNRWWTCEQTFSNKPPGKDKGDSGGNPEGCDKKQIDNPLMQPPQVSGSFIRYTEEATEAELVQVVSGASEEFAGSVQRDSTKIMNSAFEQIRGPQVEFDANRPQVVIEQNVLNLELGLLTEYNDCVNDRSLWGIPKRCIKFTSGPWSRKFHGTCNVYYTRQLVFDIWVKVNARGELVSGHDRILLDEGTKALHGKNSKGEWVLTEVKKGDWPDRNNPMHYVRYKDAHGENARVILDGRGEPVDSTPGTGSGTGEKDPGEIRVFKYPERNLLNLGVPVSF